MFDLDQSITDWRRRLAKEGVQSPVALDELESHLREEITALTSKGISEDKAFNLATSRLGKPQSLAAEFDHVQFIPRRLVSPGLWWWAAGILLVTAWLLKIRTNGKPELLLYAHIVTITAGYGSAIFAGCLGIVHVINRFLSQRFSIREQLLARIICSLSYFSAGMSVTGFVLGMAWARQNLGAMWSNDPREIGGLMVVAWLVATCLMQRSGRLNLHAAMLLSLVGSTVVTLAWFGAAMVVRAGALPGYASGGFRLFPYLLMLQILCLGAGIFQTGGSVRELRKA